MVVMMMIMTMMMMMVVVATIHASSLLVCTIEIAHRNPSSGSVSLFFFFTDGVANCLQRLGTFKSQSIYVEAYGLKKRYAKESLQVGQRRSRAGGEKSIYIYMLQRNKLQGGERSFTDSGANVRIRLWGRYWTQNPLPRIGSSNLLDRASALDRALQAPAPPKG
jgi:hypothetical protein